MQEMPKNSQQRKKVQKHKKHNKITDENWPIIIPDESSDVDDHLWWQKRAETYENSHIWRGSEKIGEKKHTQNKKTRFPATDLNMDCIL